MNGKTIGEYIAELRKKSGITQKELARRLNVSDKTVSRWERDENLPDLYMSADISELFGITVDELLRCGEKAAADASVQTETEQACAAVHRHENANRNGNIERMLRIKSRDYNMRSNIVRVVPFLAFAASVMIAHGFGGPGIDEWTIAVFTALIVDVSAVVYQLCIAAKLYNCLADRCADASKQIKEAAEMLIRKLVKKASVSVGTVVMMFVLTVVYLHLGDIIEFLLCGMIFAPASVIVCVVVALVVWDILKRRGKFRL